MTMKDERAKSIFLHLVAEYIAREAGRDTLITATDAYITSDRKNATVFVSVFPDTQSEHAIAFLNRHRDTLRDYLKKGSRLTHIPRITFQIDLGEKTRQRLDDITRDLT